MANTKKISFKLQIDDPEQRRLIQRLQREENISATIRIALIQYYEGAGFSNVILNDKLDQILRLLKSGAVVTPQPRSTGEEITSDGLDYLDKLGM